MGTAVHAADSAVAKVLLKKGWDKTAAAREIANQTDLDAPAHWLFMMHQGDRNARDKFEAEILARMDEPTTTLYYIRSTDSSLCTQIPPNNGVLNFVGPLGATTNSLVGFDVSGLTGIAYASLNGGRNFGTVNLNTGAFVNLGLVGGGFDGQVTGISVQPVPEPGTIVQLASGLAMLAGCMLRRRKALA